MASEESKKHQPNQKQYGKQNGDGKANDIAEKRGHFNTALLSNGLDHEIRPILNINPEVGASKSLFNII